MEGPVVGATMLIFMLIFVGVIVFAAKFFFNDLTASVTAPGRSLQQKFVALGTLAGKTRTEIEATVGPPQGVSGTPDGKVLCQWMSTGYHICLLFKDDICEGITHEFAA